MEHCFESMQIHYSCAYKNAMVTMECIIEGCNKMDVGSFETVQAGGGVHTGGLETSCMGLVTSVLRYRARARFTTYH